MPYNYNIDKWVESISLKYLKELTSGQKWRYETLERWNFMSGFAHSGCIFHNCRCVYEPRCYLGRSAGFIGVDIKNFDNETGHTFPDTINIKIFHIHSKRKQPNAPELIEVHNDINNSKINLLNEQPDLWNSSLFNLLWHHFLPLINFLRHFKCILSVNRRSQQFIIIFL